MKLIEIELRLNEKKLVSGWTRPLIIPIIHAHLLNLTVTLAPLHPEYPCLYRMGSAPSVLWYSVMASKEENDP